MAEYINRETVWRKVNRAQTIEEALIEIDKIPAADVEEVKHGEWNKIECGTICTHCGRVYDKDFEFSYSKIKEYFKCCPECGAKMDEERK